MTAVTIAEAARQLGISSSGVSKRIARGQLRVRRVHGQVRVLLDGASAVGTGGLTADGRGDGPEDSSENVGSSDISLVAALQAQLAAQATENAQLWTEIAALQERLRESHVLLERAQRLALPGPRDSEPPPGDGIVSGPWWQRWAWWRR